MIFERSLSQNINACKCLYGINIKNFNQVPIIFQQVKTRIFNGILSNMTQTLCY